VSKGSKATQAGIMPGELLVGIEGEKLRNFNDLRNELLRKQVGDKVKITIVRNGESMEKEVELVRRGDTEQ
jgi:S1-C subfamily serine protease